jgi:hypothetical protein
VILSANTSSSFPIFKTTQSARLTSLVGLPSGLTFVFELSKKLANLVWHLVLRRVSELMPQRASNASAGHRQDHIEYLSAGLLVMADGLDPTEPLSHGARRADTQLATTARCVHLLDDPKKAANTVGSIISAAETCG